MSHMKSLAFYNIIGFRRKCVSQASDWLIKQLYTWGFRRVDWATFMSESRVFFPALHYLSFILLIICCFYTLFLKPFHKEKTINVTQDVLKEQKLVKLHLIKNHKIKSPHLKKSLQSNKYNKNIKINKDYCLKTTLQGQCKTVCFTPILKPIYNSQSSAFHRLGTTQENDLSCIFVRQTSETVAVVVVPCPYPPGRVSPQDSNAYTDS